MKSSLNMISVNEIKFPHYSNIKLLLFMGFYQSNYGSGND